MTGLVDWAAAHARMVIAFIVLSLVAGGFAYGTLPKEGEPDIEVPSIFVSVMFPGISAEDSEKLLVKVMETELSDLDGLKSMQGTAAENYAGVALEFEFGWDKTKILADIRDAMNTAEGEFPQGAEKYTIKEVNFSEFPILIVSLSGPVPERTMVRLAKNLQDRLESLEPVLEAGIAGNRDEMVEVLIDPLRLESYAVTAAEMIAVVQNNNKLIAAGEVKSEQGAFAIKIPASYDEARDIYDLPIKTNGDRVITLGDVATINLTFEDRTSTARFNGENTIALQVVKRKGFNIIDTVALIRETVADVQKTWPKELRTAIQLNNTNDQSRTVSSMVSQLEGSVLTAICLVMIVVLAALGIRPSLLVGFAIPTSFLLCFALLALMEISISNIVMFGLILAVGMLVDGAIVVVEYADKRIAEGVGPMHAYVDAAKRMFWPVVSSTATTLCAFLPMLFWPGIPGQFMRMLPVTLIFVLSASLLVALIYLPVMGGVSGRLSRFMTAQSAMLREATSFWLRVALVPISILIAFIGAMQLLNRSYLFGDNPTGPLPPILGPVILIFGLFVMSIVFGAITPPTKPHDITAGYRRTKFGRFIHIIVGNPVMPLVAIGAISTLVATVFFFYKTHNLGVEFFVDSQPENAIVYVRARGNLSIDQKDHLVRSVEEVILAHPNITSAFAFSGDGGLKNNTGGSRPPLDTIGQVQIELTPWEERPATEQPWFRIPILGIELTRKVKAPEYDGNQTIDELTEQLSVLPGIKTEILTLERGPASAKPVHVRIKGDNWEDILSVTKEVRHLFDDTFGLTLIEDTLPLPGIDWQVDVDVEQAGRYGADVAMVGAMVQLITRGVLLDTMRVDSSDDEIDIRIRLPEEDRVLTTLDTLKLGTHDGMIPLSNFISRHPMPKLAQIDRIDQTRFFDVKADFKPGLQMVSLQAPPKKDDKEVSPKDDEKNSKKDDEAPEPIALFTGHEVTDTDEAPGNLTIPFTTTYFFGLFSREHERHFIAKQRTDDLSIPEITKALNGGGSLIITPMTANSFIEDLTKKIDSVNFPAGVSYEWTGDQEDQAESQAFLQTAFIGALALMFVILLAQFNSFYNSVLVLMAVVLSTTGVLVGMLVMAQPFSVIMTGVGIVALAGIVVNNNIVLIDTYQDFSRYLPRLEAITRTAEARIRPVLLTTITTMAGLTPMMFGLSLDFINGGYSIDSPTAMWWKQLATAVVFGLGIATILTLIFTPAMLAIRIWAMTYVLWGAQILEKMSFGETSRAARDWALERQAARVRAPEIIWGDESPNIGGSQWKG